MRRPWAVRPVLVAAILAGSSAHAQIPRSAPGQELAAVSFEVASVKANRRSVSGDGVPVLRMHPSGRFEATRVTVMRLVLVAYDVRAYQVVGGPDWIRRDYFDIAAQAPIDVELGHTRAMMRRLLEQRFGLVVRKDARQMPTYSLAWADSSRQPGPWLRPPSPDCDTDVPPRAPPETTGRPGEKGGLPQGSSATRGSTDCPSRVGFTGVGWIYMRRGSLSSFVPSLGIEAGRPVIDKTGLAGTYDVDLKWSPESRSEFPETAGGAPELSTGLSLFTAVREQLGLKLEPTNAEVAVLVIDRVERPTPN